MKPVIQSVTPDKMHCVDTVIIEQVEHNEHTSMYCFSLDFWLGGEKRDDRNRAAYFIVRPKTKAI